MFIIQSTINGEILGGFTVRGLIRQLSDWHMDSKVFYVYGPYVKEVPLTYYFELSEQEKVLLLNSYMDI